MKPPAARSRRRVVRRILVALLAVLAFVVVANLPTPKPTSARASTPPELHDSGALPVIGRPSGLSRVEPRLSRVASIIAGEGTEVRCWSVWDWRKLAAGWGSWRGRALGEWGAYTAPWPGIPNAARIHLSPAICATLDRLLYEHVPAHLDPWPGALAFAVGALAHESQHVAGEANEARAECFGVQSIGATVEALGRTVYESRYLASVYWETIYRDRVSGTYWSAECRDGGSLDLHPEMTRWP